MNAPLPFHPYADAFPLIEGDEFVELREDIRATELHDEIWLLEGAVLDGRNRYRACREIDPAFGPENPAYAKCFRVYEGDDPLAFVISRNLRRRQLNESQRAMVAAKLATFRGAGRPAVVNPPIGGISAAQAASALNVGERSVERGREVIDHGIPELQRAVEQGVISISAAAILARAPRDEQLIAIEEGRAAVVRAAKAIGKEKRDKRFSERVERIREQAVPNPALPIAQRYPVIYADPPWRYEDQPMGFTDRSIENHYETMPLEEICALPVKDLATPDAVLFLWITSPQMHLPVRRKIGDAQALGRGLVTVDDLMQPRHVPGQIEVVEFLDPDTVMANVLAAWGGKDPQTGEPTPFIYKAQYCWDKEIAGPGHWARTQHEILIAATRGKFLPPPEHLRPPSIYREKKGPHSAKPDYYANLIREFWDLPRIELFARKIDGRPVARPGWDVWGNQAPPKEEGGKDG